MFPPEHPITAEDPLLLLVNTTKLMDFDTPTPSRLATTDPSFADTARGLVKALRRHDARALARLMDLNPELADETRLRLQRWGGPDSPVVPALYAFSGLVFKHLDAPTLDAAARRCARRRLRILSGLYGLLRPFDRVEAYRLEMGCRFAPPGGATLTGFWRERLTDALNAELQDDEPVLSVASQEYLKAIDEKRLRGPIVRPVFKEQRTGGRLVTPVVHAKMARGALLRYALDTGAHGPADLLGFSAMGWEAAEAPPQAGEWLFVRPPQ